LIRTSVIVGNIGNIILIVGIAMLTCLPWSFAYNENVLRSIALSAFITITFGLLIKFICPVRDNINYKEGFLLVSLGWIVASSFGSLPYMLSGCLPSFADAFFETVSGFTTTGSSVFTDVEVLPKGILFWRCLTQWLGGMGIIALFIAIMSGMGARANFVYQAEVPGPISDKVSPRVRDTARKLWVSYVIISLVCFLILAAFGMDVFDALCHTFATMATGGFSNKNASIGFYASPWIQWTITLFMFIAGVNFTLHFMAFKQRSLMGYLKDSEFKLYTSIVVLFSLAIAFSLNSHGTAMGWEEKLRAAFFQVVSMITTTGFATANFDIWPTLSIGVLFLTMFVGGCTGSTGGSIKPGRYLIILSGTINELKKMVHPKAILPLRFGGKVVKESLLINILIFFFLYFIFLAIGTIILALGDIDIWSSLTAAATCLGNIGPGFGKVGPTQNFAFISDLGKYTLSILMLVGRLEIYPILLIILPRFWKE
jgi:trk system potassium uptake protein TrkH